jgi:hypothetical protein
MRFIILELFPLVVINAFLFLEVDFMKFKLLSILVILDSEKFLYVKN